LKLPSLLDGMGYLGMASFIPHFHCPSSTECFAMIPMM